MNETPLPADFSDLVAAADSAAGFWNTAQDEEWDAVDDAAFRAELERRLESIANGTADRIPWDQARKEIRAELERRRAERQN